VKGDLLTCFKVPDRKQSLGAAERLVLNLRNTELPRRWGVASRLEDRGLLRKLEANLMVLHHPVPSVLDLASQ
jgi:hypothetical protein